MLPPRRKGRGTLSPLRTFSLYIVLVVALLGGFAFFGSRLVPLLERRTSSLLGNQTQSGRRQHAGMQELMLKVSQALEQQEEWQRKEHEERNRQLSILQRALEDVRDSVARQESQSADVASSGKLALEDLKVKVEDTLRSSVSEQRGMLEEQNAMLERIHAATVQRESTWEYLEQKQKQPGNFTFQLISEDKPSQWQQRSFRKYGSYGFIRYSAYRTSRTDITILGLAARVGEHSRRLNSCEWESVSGVKIPGTLSATYDTEHHSLMYQTVMLHCTLNEPIKEPGGSLRANIDYELMYLYSEGSSQLLEEPKAGSFLYNLAFCGPPMFGGLHPDAVKDFFDYHYVYVGAEHFVLYDAGAVSPDVLDAIRPYMSNGLVTLTNFREAATFDVWSWAQTLAIHDCAYRLRPLASWVFMQDLDEYFEVVPPQTVKGLLKEYEDKAWLTTGCVVFSVHHCAANKTIPPRLDEGSSSSRDLLLSRMVFRWPHVYCQAEQVEDRNKCLGQWGHRKYIVNPRKITRMEIHEIKEPATGGVHLSVAEARQAHFQGLVRKGELLCDQGVPDSWWKHYDRITRIGRAVQGCKRDPKSKLCYPLDEAVGASTTTPVEIWGHQ